jgi:hypothetical protein
MSETIETEYAWRNDCGEIRLTTGAATSLTKAQTLNGDALRRTVTTTVTYGEWEDFTPSKPSCGVRSDYGMCSLEPHDNDAHAVWLGDTTWFWWGSDATRHGYVYRDLTKSFT